MNPAINANTCIEITVAKVTKGKEQQVFGEYFPNVRPLMQEQGMSRGAHFGILATNHGGVAPDAGAFSLWPGADAFRGLVNKRGPHREIR